MNKFKNYPEIFEKNRYCVVRDAISQELVSLISQYALFDEMQDFTPDGVQVPAAHSKYSDPAIESLMLLLGPKMEQITGLKLYPTYSFFRVYRNKDELVKHKDRESCEISTTISFNYSYDSNKFQWPIYIEGNKVNLNPGDMVVYRGCELEHWREPFCIDEDAWHVQAFLHYVDVNGPNAEWKYDKRKKPGKLYR